MCHDDCNNDDNVDDSSMTFLYSVMIIFIEILFYDDDCQACVYY